MGFQYATEERAPPTGQYANIGQTRQDVPNAKCRSLEILVNIEEKKIECRLDYGQQF